jgi:hypothetical protein
VLKNVYCPCEYRRGSYPFGAASASTATVRVSLALALPLPPPLPPPQAATDVAVATAITAAPVRVVNRFMLRFIVRAPSPE